MEAVSFTVKGRMLFAHIDCEIDHHTAKRLRERIDRELFISRPEMLVLDFTGVGFMDSSGIALILGRVETAESLGCGVQLRGMNRTVSKLVHLSGIEKISNLTVLP